MWEGEVASNERREVAESRNSDHARVRQDRHGLLGIVFQILSFSRDHQDRSLERGIEALRAWPGTPREIVERVHERVPFAHVSVDRLREPFVVSLHEGVDLVPHAALSDRLLDEGVRILLLRELGEIGEPERARAHEGLQTLRVSGSEGDTDRGAVRVSPEARGVDVRIIEDRRDVRGVTRHAMVFDLGGSTALAPSALVDQDLSESGQRVEVTGAFPNPVISAGARVKDEGGAVSPDVVVDGYGPAADEWHSGTKTGTTRRVDKHSPNAQLGLNALAGFDGPTVEPGGHCTVLSPAGRCGRRIRSSAGAAVH